MIRRVKEPNERNSDSMLGTLNPHFQKGLLVPPQVQESGSSRGPGGKQIEAILRAVSIIKKKGVTRDHVVFSFISRRTQPLQLRKHPAFRYEGTQDPTRMSSEPMAQPEVVKRCCKILDNFDKPLTLPTLFSAQNHPKNSWVRALDTMSSTCSQPFSIFCLSIGFFLQKNYKSWYCMPPTSANADSDDSKKWKVAPGSILQRKVHRLNASQ